MSDFASPYDTALRAVHEKISAARAKDPSEEPDNETARGMRAAFWEEQFRQRAELLTKRAQDHEDQDKHVAAHYSDPLFNAGHWRKVGWISQAARAAGTLNPDCMEITHRQGGMLRIMPSIVCFDEVSTQNRAAIADSVTHAAQAWPGRPLKIVGNEAFKATLWAYAQLQGIEIVNYAPQGASRELAEQIMQAAAPRRPERPTPNHDARLAA